MKFGLRILSKHQEITFDIWVPGTSFVVASFDLMHMVFILK